MILMILFLYHHLQMGADEDKIKWLLSQALQSRKKQKSKRMLIAFSSVFYTQFKRQTLPEGPKILGISLSPRGEYRMPSDVIKKVML